MTGNYRTLSDDGTCIAIDFMINRYSMREFPSAKPLGELRPWRPFPILN